MSELTEANARRFYKMTGSGNDFVFFDARQAAPGDLEQPEVIARLSARGTGIGADGVVFLTKTPGADIGLRYYNADGSLAALCGNATLCTVSLAGRLGGINTDGFTIETGSGVLKARMQGGQPEFDFPDISVVEPSYSAISKAAGELRLGFAVAGVPHVVIQLTDLAALERADVVSRGRLVRFDPSLAEGANVNFVARESQESDGVWSIRTYERGVEDETLACGTGNVAAAILLSAWGEASGDVTLITRSGQELSVRQSQSGGVRHASLRGEGRLVFIGELGSL